MGAYLIALPPCFHLRCARSHFPLLRGWFTVDEGSLVLPTPTLLVAAKRLRISDRDDRRLPNQEIFRCKRVASCTFAKPVNCTLSSARLYRSPPLPKHRRLETRLETPHLYPPPSSTFFDMFGASDNPRAFLEVICKQPQDPIRIESSQRRSSPVACPRQCECRRREGRGGQGRHAASHWDAAD